METTDERTFKERVDDLKSRAKQNVAIVWEWCAKNKDFLLNVALPVTVFGISEGVKTHKKNQKLERMIHFKEDYIYDDHNRHYYELCRKPTNKEWMEIDDRKAHGESLGCILNDMQLLK